MKKILSIIITVILTVLMLFPVNTQAAATVTKAGTVNITSGSLNVRRSASSSSAVISSLKKHSFVALVSKSGLWWYAEYEKGKFGYVHEDYITTMSGVPMTVSISSGSLNVRSGPSTAYEKTGSLTRGETVIVLSSSGEWKRILYHGTKTGYVSRSYLKDPSEVSSYPALKLSVPDFKQTDSRWSDVIIGNSGKTIGKIGCATTAIAMMQSYRTGTTIYPDAMSKKLNYSSSGNVYWPSDYVVTTNGTGYLAKIYDLLKQGKPVLFGAKNSYGGQHWVVITGYKGGDALFASDFIINDPGSKTRTTLGQFMNSYPVFYKYFHY